MQTLTRNEELLIKHLESLPQAETAKTFLIQEITPGVLFCLDAARNIKAMNGKASKRAITLFFCDHQPQPTKPDVEAAIRLLSDAGIALAENTVSVWLTEA